MRAFIAIDLPSEIKAGLVKIQDKLKIILPETIWVKPSNLHLSLKFLGNISLPQLEFTQQAITEISKTTCSFKIKLDILGVFADYRQTRIIWIGTSQPTVQLQQLAGQFEAKLITLGLPQETHLFQPHITLGRIKQPASLINLKKELDILNREIPDMNLKFDARDTTLYQSILGPGGPTYHRLK